jgi:hypothetical protein
MLNWKRGKRQFSAQDYGTGLQTILDIKNSTNKFMKFAMNCDSGIGPSNWKSMKKLYKEVDVVLLRWFNWKQSRSICLWKHWERTLKGYCCKVMHMNLALSTWLMQTLLGMMSEREDSYRVHVSQRWLYSVLTLCQTTWVSLCLKTVELKQQEKHELSQ